ncbi:MAG TPA: Crp/Fnr family transcriptional regulator [Patescibacteria group bacterium]|nr:Crp/Fnr family transcriptional regulator [Patescibacteria group bacterium]
MLTTDSQLEALVNLFHQGTRLVYEKGEFVIRPGGPPQGIFYILSGLVKAYDITKFGEENLIIIRKPGEILGLTWGVTGEDRHIIYSTLMHTELLQISRQQFIDYLQANPTAALPLNDILTDMYQQHSERIITLAYRTVRERLVSFLLNMSRRFGKETPEGLKIDAPLRHQDIASSISATRETTGRELAALERQGLLTNKQSIVVLKDTSRLKKYLQ